MFLFSCNRRTVNFPMMMISINILKQSSYCTVFILNKWKTWIAYRSSSCIITKILIFLCIHSSCNISRRTGLTRSAMQSTDYSIWKSWLSLSTKLQLYNTCILPIMLYSSECWALTQADAKKYVTLTSGAWDSSWTYGGISTSQTMKWGD